jgi:hypothetical protein
MELSWHVVTAGLGPLAPLSPALERVLHTSVCSAHCGPSSQAFKSFQSNLTFLMLIQAHTSMPIGVGERMILSPTLRVFPLAVARKLLHALYGVLRSNTPYEGEKLFPIIHPCA